MVSQKNKNCSYCLLTLSKFFTKCYSKKTDIFKINIKSFANDSITVNCFLIINENTLEINMHSKFFHHCMIYFKMRKIALNRPDIKINYGVMI